MDRQRDRLILPALGPELAAIGPLVVGMPQSPNGLVALVPRSSISKRHEILKRLRDGSIVEILLDVSDRVNLDASFAADGWDVIPIHESLSIRLRLRA